MRVLSALSSALILSNLFFTRRLQTLESRRIDEVFSEIKQIHSEFDKSEISFCKARKIIDKNYYFFKTSLNDRYSGYFLLDDNYSLLLAHPEEKESYSSVNDFFTAFENFIKDNSNTDKKRNIKETTHIKCAPRQFLLPDVDKTVVDLYNGHMGLKYSIKNVPEYYNGFEGKYKVYPGGGCSPTAGAMFISFYDRYSSYFSDLIKDVLPLKHSEDVDKVNNLIEELGKDMHTDKNGLTLSSNVTNGINKFLFDHGHQSYTMQVEYTCVSLSEDGNAAFNFAKEILLTGNIAILHINENCDFFSSDSVGHTIVLTGITDFKYTGKTLQVNYGHSTLSQCSISPKIVGDMKYLGIYKGD